MKQKSLWLGVGILLVAAIVVMFPLSQAAAAISFGSVTSGANSSSGASTIVLGKPSSTAAGDLLLAGIVFNGGSDITIAPSSTPGGWILIERTDRADDVGMITYYKIAGASEPSTYSWTLGTSGATRRAAGGIIRYTGVSTSSPIAASAESEGANDNSAVAPSVVTTGTNQMVVNFFGIDNDSSLSTPSGTTSRFDVDNTDNSGPRIKGTDVVKASAGATGSKSSTISPGNEDWVAQTIALREATAAPSTGTFVIRKSVINNNGGTAATSSFSFMVDGGAATAFEADGENAVIVSVGDHTAVELEAEGYATNYSNCAEMSVTAGGTTVCTITNDDIPAQLTIVKHADGGDATFGFTVSQGSTTISSPSVGTAAGTGSSDPINLNVGTYNVVESLIPGGWDFDYSYCSYEGGGAGVEIENGEQITVALGDVVTCHFYNDKRASLSIVKLTDPADGEFLFGVSGPGGYVASTTFAPQGNLNLTDLLPGSYSITESVLSPEDWSGSQAIVCNGDGSGDPTPGSLAGQTPYNLNLDPGETMTCYVNNTQDGLVSGKKFEDVDGAGSGSTGSGLQGWTMTYTQLDDPMTSSTDESAGGVSGYDYTDEEGDYSFLLQPGLYRVCESPEPNWYQSYPTTNVGCPDGYPNGYEITVAAGSNTGDIDFGNYRNGTISGYKWNDEDADGVWDETEFGLSGWSIQLGGDDSDSTVTGEDGSYSFTVAPGSYTLQEVLQSGWAQSFPTSGPHAVTVSSNGSVNGYNFGNVNDATISGSKWNDEDADGIWDEGEPALTGWRIYIDLNGNSSWDGGEPYADTAGEGGTYTIAGLLPGDYIVREASQDNWSQTYPGEGGAHEVSLAIGENATGVNFGNAYLITIDGQKWGDLNKNGLKDVANIVVPQPDLCFPPLEEGGSPFCIPQPPLIIPQPEVGLSSWTIIATPMISDGEGGYTDDTESGREAKTVVTNSNGDYSFDFLPTELGWWRLAEQLPAGWVQTFPASPAYHYVNITDPHPAYEPFNFGNWQNPVVQVQKWNDANNNGVRDQGEASIANWPMALGEVVSSSESNISVEIVALSLTNASGTATLYVPDAGNYVVMEGETSGWTLTYPNPLRPVTMTVNFADGVTPIPLETDSFFDVFFGLNQGGQTITQGQKYNGEGTSIATLEFGNHKTAANGGNEVVIAEFGGGGGPQNGPTGGTGGGQVLGASTSTTGGNGGTGGSQVLGETTCKLPLSAYVRRGGTNDPAIVKDLQNFLNTELKLQPPLPLTGFFGPATEAAVKQFQMKYYEEVLKPWVDLGLLPANTATGLVYKMTLWKIQKLGCPDAAIAKPQLP